MKMSDSVYDALKWIAQILLPAAATLYWALAEIWGLPLAEQIVGTVTAVDAFLGVLLGISSHVYYCDEDNCHVTVLNSEEDDGE